MKSTFLFCAVAIAGSAIVTRAIPQEGKVAAQRTPIFTDSLNSTHELYGPLGRPLGEAMTVTLTIEEKSLAKSWFDDYAVVTNINGYPLPQPKRIPVMLASWGKVNELKRGQALVVRAYQECATRSIPDQAFREVGPIQTSLPFLATWLTIYNEAPR